MEATPVSTALRVAVTTWDRDSHDLYDYEASPSNCKSLMISSSGKLFRVGTDVICLSDEEMYPRNADYLLSIRMLGNENPKTNTGELSGSSSHYEVVPAERNTQASYLYKKLWMIVRDLPSQRHFLNENDIIKLGRCKLRVRQLVHHGMSVGELKFDDSVPMVASKSVNEMKKLQCRICLGEGGSEEDPLIRPCHCKGSIEYVHAACLRHWISGKCNLTERSKDCFFLRLVRCELCKQSFPTSIRRKKEVIRLVELSIDSVTAPLFVLENLNCPRAYYIIPMNLEKDVKLGRGHDCDLRISDVSISRHHATIRYADGQFTIQDNNSKFGTLVSLKHPLTVKQEDQLAFQAGRSVLKVNMVSSSDENAVADKAVDDGVSSKDAAGTALTDVVNYDGV